LGVACSLCKHPFEPTDEIIVCPEDGSRHHVECWQANGNRCTNYGCVGEGEVLPGGAEVEAAPVGTATAGSATRRTKVRALPSSSLGCAQSCLLLSIALAIILIAFGCFGLWAIADYILLEVLEWPYRAPISGFIPIIDFKAIPILLGI
jgi:hypothetical protein